MPGMQPPTLTEVLRAHRLLAGHLPPTPMWSYPALNQVAGATVYLKHENYQPVGAFKVRGGLNLLARPPDRERSRGVVTYSTSTGNHTQSIAYAAPSCGTDCRAVMPRGANQVKGRAVQALGAAVVPHGADLATAQAHAEQLAGDTGARLVSPGDEPALVAGVGTLYLEAFEAVPDLDAVVVPVGSGTGAAAACLVAGAVASGCRIVAVQSSAAPAPRDSWRCGACVQRPDRTGVEGLATGRGVRAAAAAAPHRPGRLPPCV